MASYFSGIALANAGLGTVHALSRPFGGMFNLSHGLVCAILLPHITEYNWKYNIVLKDNSLKSVQEVLQI